LTPSATGSVASTSVTTVRGVVPAVDFASLLLPELTERGSGGLFFAGGLSSVVPMPPLANAPDYLEYVRNPANGYLSQSIPFEDGRGNALTIYTG
jgi:hypothetical protein